MIPAATARAQGPPRAAGDGVKNLAAQVSAGIAKEQKRKVGVLPFTDLDGRATTLGAFLAEELTTQLFAGGAFGSSSARCSARSRPS